MENKADDSSEEEVFYDCSDDGITATVATGSRNGGSVGDAPILLPSQGHTDPDSEWTEKEHKCSEDNDPEEQTLETVQTENYVLSKSTNNSSEAEFDSTPKNAKTEDSCSEATTDEGRECKPSPHEHEYDSTSGVWNTSRDAAKAEHLVDTLGESEGQTAAVEGDNQSDKEESSEDENTLPEEQIEERKIGSKKLKDEGNERYKSGDVLEAERLYSEGLKICPKRFQKERAILFSNRSACLVKLEKTEPAIDDCSKAIELHPTYLKAYLRRAQLYEKLEKFEEATKDYEKIIKMDPSIHTARAALLRLPEEIEKRNEKLKTQMMSSLKDLGDLFLRPFGLSTNNFQMQQDPNTGSYNIQFNNNPGQNRSSNGPTNGPHDGR